MIETVKELLTKKGDRMAFIQLSNLTDTIEMVAFPEVYQAHREFLTPGSCVAIKGKLSIRNEEPSVLLDKLKILSPKTEEAVHA
jgi:DNA polymerase III subunit alpha